MKYVILFLSVVISLSSSLGYATLAMPIDEGFATMYHDRLSSFTQSSNYLISSDGGAEEGSIALGVSGAYYDYTQCDYTGTDFMDYSCETMATPISTTRLSTTLIMPYRVAFRPLKNKRIDMSIMTDLHLSLSFSDGTNTFVIPDAHIAGKFIMKSNRNLHFYISDFDVSLDGTVMDATDQADMQAVITLIKSKILHTWYFTKVEKSTYDEFIALVEKSSQTSMPVDIQMIMKSGILENLGRDQQIGKYRVSINTDGFSSITQSLIPTSDYIPELQDDSMIDETGITLSGSLGKEADGHIALTIDNITVPLDEDSVDISNCALAGELTTCTVSGGNASGDTLSLQLSGSNTSSGGSFGFAADVSSKELIGTMSMSLQRATTLLREGDFALPRRSKSIDKAMKSFDTMF